MFKNIIVILVILGILLGMFTINARVQNNRRQQREAQQFEENIMDFSPEEVIEYHYRWINDHNLFGLNLTSIEEFDTSFNFRNLISFRRRNLISNELLSVSEITNEGIIRGLREVSWFPHDMYDIKYFRVESYITRRNQYGHGDGVIETALVVVRETQDSPWVIYRGILYWIL